MSTRVSDVYSNRSVFLTGGTGFLGKVIIEKLLWSVDDICRIYLLIRPHKGKAPRERLDVLLKDPLFERLHEYKPKVFEKLVPIVGDMMEEQLGINQHDMQTICENVSIVIHSAATVKFDEQLKTAVEMNVLGTTRIIALCHKINHLISLVHVSTAYANCDLAETEEMIYKPPVPPQELMAALRWMDADMINLITPQLLGKRPNTYTLTKALAETQMQLDSKGLPVIIIRPSIVGAMWNEPLPGWTDNINGPTGIFAAVGKGVLTNMCGSKTSKADIIPVDIVANTIIVAGAHRSKTHYDDIPIIHCTSGDLNPVYWETIVRFLEQFYNKYPLTDCFGVPSTKFHQSRNMFLLNYYTKHHIPAKVLDLVYNVIGKKPNNVRLYSKVWKMIETLHFFTTHGWTFHSKGLPKLWDSLHAEDRKIYKFDVREVNWDSYLFDYVMGIKKYILKESLNNFQQARKNLFMLKLRRFAITSVGYYLLIRIFGRNWSRERKMWSFLGAMTTTHVVLDVNFRQKVQLKSLAEYKKQSTYHHKPTAQLT